MVRCWMTRRTEWSVSTCVPTLFLAQTALAGEHYSARPQRTMLRRLMAVVSVVAVLPATLGAASADRGRCAVVDSSGFCRVAAAHPARPGGPADPTRKPRRPVEPTVPTPGPTPL